jgi:hypothetical protein
VPNRLNAFLTSSSELRLLTYKARQLMTLQQQLEQIIPPSLRRGCRVMQLDQQTLTLSADNGAIAAKLRQMTAELAAKLRGIGVDVTVIQILVQVSTSPHIAPPEVRCISPSGKNQLTEFAEKLDDSPLKDALKRLAKRS